MHFRQSHQHPSIKVLNPDWSSIGYSFGPLIDPYWGVLFIFGRWDWHCFLWGWQTSSMIMRTSGATRTIFWRRHDMTWLLFEEHSYSIPICPCCFALFLALMSPSHRMPMDAIHASMEHLIPSLSWLSCIAFQELTKCFEQEACRIKGSLQNVDFEDMAPRTWRGSAEGRLFLTWNLVRKMCQLCVEHVARIQFNISKLHNWARYIAIWYKLAMSFSPPTLCLLVGPVVKGRQRSGKGHCQLQLLYSRKSNRLPTADHSRSIIWRTPPRRHKGNLRHLLLQNTASLVQFISSHTSLKEFHRTGMSTGDLLRRQLCPHDGWSGWRRMKTRNARLDVQWCASIGSQKLRPFCNKVLHTLFANWNALQGRHARAFLRSHALETASDLWANLVDEWMRALAMSQLWLPRQTPRVVH